MKVYAVYQEDYCIAEPKCEGETWKQMTGICATKEKAIGHVNAWVSRHPGCERASETEAIRYFDDCWRCENPEPVTEDVFLKSNSTWGGWESCYIVELDVEE